VAWADEIAALYAANRAAEMRATARVRLQRLPPSNEQDLVMKEDAVCRRPRQCDNRVTAAPSSIATEKPAGADERQTGEAHQEPKKPSPSRLLLETRDLSHDR
jgi:hypothetical protein